MTPQTTSTLADAPVCRNCNIELTEVNWYPSYRERNTYLCKRCDSDRKGHHPYDENPTCGMYLGIHIAEQILSSAFKNVERMPPTNPGYDFVCNRGLIDAKSACARKNGSWQFAVRYNTTADFFLCLAFDNREDLTPLHAWLIPGTKINHLSNISIYPGTLSKWDEYRIDTSKVCACCDELNLSEKYENNISTRPAPTHNKTPRLSILSYLAAGLNPIKIAAKLDIPMSTLQYHLDIMKHQELIRKVGYGTWEVLKEPTTEKPTVRGLSHVAIHKTPQQVRTFRTSSQSDLTRFKQDAVRAHAFVFTLRVPKGLRNWNNEGRTQFMTAHQIPYKSLGIGGGGQRIIIKGRKVWLTNPSIIIYDKSSYFAEEALKAKSKALATHISIIKHMERLLHISFRIGSDYKFKVSRQHYALIYNALAEQYNETGEKMEIRTEKGVWFLIDNSYNMNEAETVHPSSAMTDNRKVQNFFNGLKEQPITPGFVLEMMHGIQTNQMLYASNIETHISAIQDLGSGVKDMNKLLKKFGGR